MRFRPAVLLISVALTGCSLFGDDNPDIEIRTDTERYTPIPDEVVSLTVSNNSDRPIFYICTGQIYLEELDGDRIVNRWMIHGFEECLSPGPIDAGEEEVFEIGFDDKSALGNIQGALFDESVRYRLSVDLFWDLNFNRAIGERDRRSNTFLIVRNPVR